MQTAEAIAIEKDPGTAPNDQKHESSIEVVNVKF